TIDVVDGAGCSGAQQTVTINDQLTGTVVVTNASCSNGAINVTALGGDGNYVYSVVTANDPIPADGTFNNTNPISQPAGTYDVYIRDQNGAAGYCQFIIEDVVIASVVNVSISETANQPVCNGDLGSIDITISNGESPHSFVVTNSGGATVATLTNFVGTSTSFNDLPAETYTITITDSLGCTDSKVVTLTNPTALVMDIEGVPPPLCGVSDPANTGFNFININPANYAPYTLQYSVDNGVTWFDFTNGQIRGYNPGDIVYPTLRISDGTGGTGNTRCILSYGQYIIPFNVSGIVVDVQPSGDCTTGYNVTVRALNGLGPFEFSINSSTGPWLSAIQAGPVDLDPTNPNSDFRRHIFTNITPGLNYQFYVRDTNTGCIEMNDLPLTFPDSSYDVDITATTSNESCSGTLNDGEITFTINDTDGLLELNTIDWQLFDAITNAPLTTPVTGTIANTVTYPYDLVVSGLNPGSYYLVIERDSGMASSCSWGSPDVEIKDGTPIAGNLTVVNNITCDVDGTVRIEGVNGGFPGYTYAATVNETGVPGNLIAFTLTGNIISVDDAALGGVTSVDVSVTITDTNGCTTTLGPVTLTLSPSPTLEIGDITTSTCGTNKTITVTGNNGLALGGTPPYQYSSDGGTTYSASTTNTSYTFNGLTPGSYDIVVKDANGCTAAQNGIIIYPELDFTLITTQNLNCVPGEAVIGITVDSGAGLSTSGNFTYTINGVGATPNPALTSGSILGTSTSTTHTVTAEGTYEIIMTDVTSGCMITQQITISPAIVPNFSAVASVNNICYGSSTGVIQITELNNSINPLSYSISVLSGGPYAGTINTSTLTYENLPEGVYRITGTGT
ncbi:hypothetical protein ACQY1Q_09390, partial [Tenacibaculum sp. TC6]|uniref:hypothetical protein n=1 Tax=Tenacibaculum sp. TC6 TaxID=3423223 RepID=UPI003D36C05D